MKNLFLLLFLTTFIACNDTAMQDNLSNLEKELAETKAKLAEATAAKDAMPGLIHNVFFWLKEDLSDADRAAFLKGCQSLTGIETVRKAYIGPPAPTEARGVVDNTFDYALLIHFDDVAGQDAYQVAPIHLKFVEENKDKWTKVIVYDNNLIQ